MINLRNVFDFINDLGYVKKYYVKCVCEFIRIVIIEEIGIGVIRNVE